MTIVLTEDEINLIIKRRERKAEATEKVRRELEFLDIVANYGKLLAKNGCDTSYSTFVSEFGDIDYKEKKTLHGCALSRLTELCGYIHQLNQIP